MNDKERSYQLLSSLWIYYNKLYKEAYERKLIVQTSLKTACTPDSDFESIDRETYYLVAECAELQRAIRLDKASESGPMWE